MTEPSRRILVVDDEPDIRLVVERRLTLKGYEVITAATGYEGLNKARGEHPDLIVLDLMLPGIDGNQICAMLKRDTRYRDIPIIILSAKSQTRDIDVSMSCGADAYVAKPFDHQVLLDQIESLLAGRATDSETTRDRSPGAPMRTGVPVARS
jgi:DNA-binding response OmpR family regulator